MTPGWKSHKSQQSLGSAHRSILVPTGGSAWRKVLAFAGPGLMIAVGYMDPGNWATNIAGGAQFGFTLLFVILLSNLFAMVLQHLALKLGIASGKDLAQACRDHYSRPISFMLWILCELAIAACDLAEVIGSAVALNLLFHIPLSIGVLITVADVLLLLLFQNRSFRLLEIIVAALILLILGAFIYEVIVAKPAWGAVIKGFVPTVDILKNPLMLYVAIGILGATVMPHNLYLHSSIVQTRKYDLNEKGKRSAIKFATLDSTMSLLLAFVINAAILILSASAFHFTNHKDVADITDAYHLLDPVLGVSLASTLFAVALLASGQNSTLTGTLAGQIVMEGFLDLKLKPWQRRMITRLIAIVPAFIVTLLWGSQGIGKLLVLSQVILSMQLSFAVFPLVAFTSDKDKMGVHVNRPWLKYISWLIAIVIAVLNVYLLVKTFV